MKGLYIALGILLLVVLWAGCGYNGMNTSRIEINKKWATVQSAYQRRADLIPNLVATVKGAADFEKSTYVQTAMARAGALKSLTQGSAAELTPEKMAAIQKASSEAQSAARLAINVAVEQYPQLKANQNFLQLQDQLEGTENRINVARNDFNNAVADYNTRVTNFPNNLLAGMFNFKEQPMFQADKESQNAPKVQF
jgi:LemA protein